MTENPCGLLTATTSQDAAAGPGAVLDSVGRAVPETSPRPGRARHEAAPGRTLHRAAGGESNSLAAGYRGPPDATRTAFQEGWYLTGDMGTVDQCGYERIVDGCTDLINSGGMNIFPSEGSESCGAGVCSVRRGRQEPRGRPRSWATASGNSPATRCRRRNVGQDPSLRHRDGRGHGGHFSIKRIVDSIRG